LSVVVNGSPLNPTINNFFHVNGRKIGVCGDPPHLIKAQCQYLLHSYATRDDGVHFPLKMSERFQRKHNLETNEILWEAVQDLVDFQVENEIVYCKNLTPATVERARNPFGKMDVKPALNIISKDVSAGISQMVQFHGRPKKYLTTAQHIWLLAHWFDIVACRDLSHAFDKRYPEQRAELIEFIKEFMEYIAEVLYYKNQKSINTVQKGTLATCKTCLWCQHEILAGNLTEFFCAGRCCLCDCVENHHFRIRDFGNKHPTPRQCIMYTKATMVTQILKKPGKGHNYQEDSSTETLIEFSNWKICVDEIMEAEEAEANDAASDVVEYQKMCIENNFDPRDFHESDDNYSTANSLSNFIGYCLLKVKERTKCKICPKIFIEPKDTVSLDPLNSFIETRKLFTKYKYCTPTYFANTVYHTCEKLFRDNRDKNSHVKNHDKNLLEYIKNVIESNFQLPSCGHFLDVLKIFLRGRFHMYATYLNIYGKKVHKAEIEGGAAHASKSSAAKVVLK
jgi:hypothetical protein